MRVRFFFFFVRLFVFIYTSLICFFSEHKRWKLYEFNLKSNQTSNERLIHWPLQSLTHVFRKSVSVFISMIETSLILCCISFINRHFNIIRNWTVLHFIKLLPSVQNKRMPKLTSPDSSVIVKTNSCYLILKIAIEK